MVSIEIADRNSNGVLTVTLHDLLRLIEQWGRELRWAVFELEAIGEVPGWDDLVKLEQEIAESPNGFVVSWSDLKQWSLTLSEIMEGTFVGFEGDGVPDILPWHEPPANCSLVLELIDSALWKVSAEDPEVIERLARTYENVTRM